MQNKRFKDMLKAFQVASKDEALLEEFLKDILTPKELEEIPTRWEIVHRLYSGEPHHKIAKELHIGVGTVTRGSKEMKDKNGGFMKVLKKLYK